jgi:ribosome modulation factor
MCTYSMQISEYPDCLSDVFAFVTLSWIFHSWKTKYPSNWDCCFVQLIPYTHILNALYWDDVWRREDDDLIANVGRKLFVYPTFRINKLKNNASRPIHFSWLFFPVKYCIRVSRFDINLYVSCANKLYFSAEASQKTEWLFGWKVFSGVIFWSTITSDPYGVHSISSSVTGYHMMRPLEQTRQKRMDPKIVIHGWQPTQWPNLKQRKVHAADWLAGWRTPYTFLNLQLFSLKVRIKSSPK